MKRMIALVLVMMILLSGVSAFAVSGSVKKKLIQQIISEFEGSTEMTVYTCKYDEESDTLALRIQMDFEYELYLQMPDYLISDLNAGFENIGMALRDTVVDTGMSEVTTVLCVVTNDSIPIALNVNTIDLLEIV